MNNIEKSVVEELSKSIAEMFEYGAETKDFHNKIIGFVRSEREALLKEIIVLIEKMRETAPPLLLKSDKENNLIKMIKNHTITEIVNLIDKKI